MCRSIKKWYTYLQLIGSVILLLDYGVFMLFMLYTADESGDSDLIALLPILLLVPIAFLTFMTGYIGTLIKIFKNDYCSKVIACFHVISTPACVICIIIFAIITDLQLSDTIATILSFITILLMYIFAFSHYTLAKQYKNNAKSIAPQNSIDEEVL